MKQLVRVSLILATAFVSGCSTQELGAPKEMPPKAPTPASESASAETASAKTVPAKAPSTAPVLPPKALTSTPVTPPPLATPPASTNTENARRILLDADFDFAQESEERGAAQAFFDFSAPEATLLPDGALPVKGRDAIQVFYAARPKGTLTWRPHDAEVAASADLGYTWGNYEFRESNAEGGPRVSYGKYVSLWKKEPDGTWKLVLHSVNTSPAPGERR
ncbi:MAG TPA: DUF4440 domain-containing protein [Candidatus Dormibacteraeota bacterium]|nr:DUF4440 domain-containing protein [Candidatus Dormibacteraeota bacterium]